ncbi:structural protein [Serratia phage vB_SmaM-Kashira]|nr:putative structural protein [Acinetobacter phage ABPH49]URC22117.1 structural protein [Serratia phage vB_SmaM-ChuuTotoro]URC22651.1 structural protein [Serratia phage vB_SmaM-Kashira]
MNTKVLTWEAYDPQKVILYMLGQKVSGYAADTKIVVSRNNDHLTPHMGVDGELSLALSRDRSGVMTVSLQNTAAWNGYLAQWQKQVDVTGRALFPVQLEGSQGLSINTFGWIQRQPDLTYGSTVEQMDWEIGLLDAWLAPDNMQGVVAGIGGLIGAV